MTRVPLHALTPETFVPIAADYIRRAKIHRVLVMKGQELLGIVTTSDIADAVAQEDGSRAFELAGRAVESGYDLRLVVRDLARLTRDVLVVRIDPSQVTDSELAAEGEPGARLG